MKVVEEKVVERPAEETQREEYYVASTWQLMRRKFLKHKLAVVSGILLVIMYVVAIFCDFFATYNINVRRAEYSYVPPQRIRIFDQGRLRLPFVYGLTLTVNPETLRKTYTDDPTQRYRVKLFVQGEEYEFWGLFKARIHLIGVEEPGTIFLFGTDKTGRDLFSRVLFAARISLSLGLVGIAISFSLGCLLGGVSGYFGGATDMIIQRIIEFLGAIPKLPLWMGLSAALPLTMSPLRVYFMITVILSIIGWTGLARVVRGKLLQLRVEDYVMAAKINGVGEMGIIWRHLLPGFASYLIVSLTLAVPGMILGETALSFIGIGLRPPVVSWGVLLQDAQNVRSVALYPWVMIPSLFVVGVVLCFNFLGDGLRDAADPYK